MKLQRLRLNYLLVLIFILLSGIIVLRIKNSQKEQKQEALPINTAKSFVVQTQIPQNKPTPQPVFRLVVFKNPFYEFVYEEDDTSNLKTIYRVKRSYNSVNIVGENAAEIEEKFKIIDSNQDPLVWRDSFGIMDFAQDKMVFALKEADFIHYYSSDLDGKWLKKIDLPVNYEEFSTVIGLFDSETILVKVVRTPNVSDSITETRYFLISLDNPSERKEIKIANL